MAEKQITRINPAITVIPKLPPLIRNKRVAAYARVSTSSDEQLASFEAQQDYYRKLITANPQWEFVCIYADEGISGTSSQKRPAFNQMIDDALAGKIDLIITKSISRFARNTVDSLNAIRALKEKSVEVYFQKENISTLDSKGEFLITLMSSLAQEESRSISENVAWGKRKRFAEGKFTIAYCNFLGYDRGSDGTMVINEEQAKIVRYIYFLYLEGRTVGDITRILQAADIQTPSGKGRWGAQVVINILRNEKYYGAALLQKTFVYDFLTKKAKKNQGELPQYYIEKDHAPIISKAHYDAVQEMFSSNQRRRTTRTPFAGKLMCGCCSQIYSRKIWHSTGPHSFPVWECPKRFQGKPKCATPHLYEDQLTNAYNAAFCKLLAANPVVTTLCLSSLKKIIPHAQYKSIEKFLLEADLEQIQTTPCDQSIWLTLVSRVVVTPSKTLQFTFIDGYEVDIDIMEHVSRSAEKRLQSQNREKISVPKSPDTIETQKGESDMNANPPKRTYYHLSEEEKKKIIDLRENGISFIDIAAQTQINYSTVKTCVHRHNKKMGKTSSRQPKCPSCGAPITQTPGTRKKKYCSYSCRMKWWSKHKEQMNRTLYTITCAKCGCSFESANPNQKYCTHTCYTESRRKISKQE